jgi:hypothetical protein
MRWLNQRRNLTTHSTGALDSVPFIIPPCGVNWMPFARARLIRALDGFLNLELSMKRHCFHLITLSLLLISLQVSISAQSSEATSSSNDQPAVVSAVAPVYPKIFPPTVDGSVMVEVVIDSKGNVLRARALNGPPLLHSPSMKAAKLWQFAPTSVGTGERKARLIFEYLIVPKGTSESELQPVYKPPYTIEVKRLKERYRIAW